MVTDGEPESRITAPTVHRAGATVKLSPWPPTPTKILCPLHKRLELHIFFA